MKRPSPALVISLIALFVALGGTSYAVSQLPKGSVGTQQLQNGAVTKSKISKATRKALKGANGATGAQGAQGAQGAAGPKGDKGDAATTLWVVLNSDGTVRKGSHVLGATGNFTSYVRVQFDREIDTCAILSSVGRTGGSFATGQTIADEFVANGFAKDTVLVQSHDSAGADAGRGVHVAVFC